jgi:hypothetical protein
MWTGMSISRRLLSPCVCLALLVSLSGCGTYIVAKSVTGAGSMVVGGAVGAVKVTGKAVGSTVGAVTGIGRDEPDESW